MGNNFSGAAAQCNQLDVSRGLNDQTDATLEIFKLVKEFGLEPKIKAWKTLLTNVLSINYFINITLDYSYQVLHNLQAKFIQYIQ